MPEETQEPKPLNQTIPGGRYEVDGKLVNAEGEPIGKGKATADEAETDSVETVESLVADNTRDVLNERAKAAGLDGDSYTNKTELATAILEAEKGK